MSEDKIKSLSWDENKKINPNQALLAEDFFDNIALQIKKIVDNFSNV